MKPAPKRPALQEAPRDDQGRLILGDPAVGCWSCGAVAKKVSEDNRTVWYHPAIGCCAPALSRQLNALQDDAAAQGRRLAESEVRLTDLRTQAEAAATPAEGARAERLLAGAEAQHAALRGEVTRNLAALSRARRAVAVRIEETETPQ